MKDTLFLILQEYNLATFIGCLGEIMVQDQDMQGFGYGVFYKTDDYTGTEWYPDYPILKWGLGGIAQEFLWEGRDGWAGSAYWKAH